MYTTYILKSLRDNKYYIGSTANFDKRLKEHNSGQTRFTRLHKPWEIYYLEKFATNKEAVTRERQIKVWKSRTMIEKLKFP